MSIRCAYALSVVGAVLCAMDGTSWTDFPAIVILIASGALAARSDIKRNPTA